MKNFAFALAAVAALAFGLSTASACGDDAKASTGTKACCAKGAKASAAGGGDGKTAAGATEAKMSCASHGKAGDKATTCPLGKDAKKTEVALTGKVLCEHCDLHKKDSCNPVFQAEGSKDYVPFCPDSDVAAVKKAGKEGKATLDVKGWMCENSKGEKMLQVSTFSEKS